MYSGCLDSIVVVLIIGANDSAHTIGCLQVAPKMGVHRLLGSFLLCLCAAPRWQRIPHPPALLSPPHHLLEHTLYAMHAKLVLDLSLMVH